MLLVKEEMCVYSKVGASFCRALSVRFLKIPVQSYWKKGWIFSLTDMGIGSKSKIISAMSFPSHFILLGLWSAFAWFLFLSRKIQSSLVGELNLGNLTPLHYSFRNKPLKWPLVHKKINYCVVVHAVVVDSVYLHMLSINIAWCLLKEIWAHTQIVLEREPSEDKVCVWLSWNFRFDLFRQVPSWDFVVLSLLRASSSLFVNTSKIFAMHYPVYCFPH